MAGNPPAEAAQPFGTDVVVAFGKRWAPARMVLVQIGEVEEQAHVERLADCAELLHQCVIEAGEMLVVEGLNYGVGNDDRAGNDGVGWRCATLNQDFVEDAEVVFDKPVFFFEVCQKDFADNQVSGTAFIAQ